jgi:hypothetical protein
MTDLFAGFTTQFAEKALESQTYPLVLQFPSNLLELEEDLGDITVVSPNSDPEVDTSYRGDTPGEVDEGSILFDQVVDGFLAALPVANSDKKKLLEESDREVIKLFAAPLDKETIDLPSGEVKLIMDLTAADLADLQAAGDKFALLGLGRLWRKIKDAVKKVAKAFVKNFKKFLAKYFRFTVKSSAVRVQSKPTAVVKNPIELRKLDLYGRVTIEACIKIGRWRCATITSPWVHITVGSALFSLSVQGPLVLGTPRVKDVDFVITIRLFGFKFDIKIGLTTIVNRELSKRPPEVILDTSKFAYEVPMLKTKFIVSQISFSSGSAYLEADLEGKFVRI